MKLNRKNTIDFCSFILITIFTLYVIFQLLSQNVTYPSGYNLLFLLPLSFFLVFTVYFFILMHGKSLFNNLPNIFLITFLFIRNVITPLAMVKDSFYSSIGLATPENALVSILLIFFETIIVVLFVVYLDKREKNTKQVEKKETIGKDRLFIYITIVFVFFIISISSILFVPEIRNNYYSIFTPKFYISTQNILNYRGNLLVRFLSTGGDIAIETLRFIFPCILFYKISKKTKSIIGLIICFILVFLQCLFMTDSNAYILMIMICQILVIIKLYPKYKKIISIGLISTVAMLSLLMFFNRFSLDHYSKSISLWLQAYFPGVANTGGIMNVYPTHNLFQMFSDLWVAIPFKSFLGYTGNVKSLAMLWSEANYGGGQIMSTISQGYYYFGFVFAPLLSCFLIYQSKKYNIKSNSSDNVLLSAAYIYLMMYSIMTPFVYNFCIYLQAFLQRFIFILLISYFCPYRFSDIETYENNNN